ncbi:MAG: hypothetical protein ACYCT7_08290 [bacterium]
MGKMLWQDEPLLDWVKRETPSWANNKIRHWHEVFPENDYSVPFRAFITKIESKRSDIDMCNVVGQWDHYANQTWINALTAPQYKPWKINNTIRLFDENGSYYFDNEEKGIHFDSIDGKKWFSNGGGNHRTVIAKFAFAIAKAKTGNNFLLKNVITNQYTVDWESYRLYKQLDKFIVNYNIKITILVDSKNNQPDFFITDSRFPKYRFLVYNNNTLYEHLKPKEFKSYAEWVINTKGNISKRDKIIYLLKSFFVENYRDSLIYPK